MRIALAQVHAEALDVTANIVRTRRAIDEAASRAADLVVLPELVSTGWVMDDPSALGRLAEVADGSGPVLSAWCQAAAERAIAVVGGFLERDGEHLYNSAIAIDRDGSIQGVYRKLHLFSSERGVVNPGTAGLPVVELAGHRVGILICYDLRFPEAMRLLALQGAELIAVPTAWVSGFDPNVDVTSPRIGQIDAAVVQANLNQVFVACGDTVGRTGGSEFLGRSMVADPYGRIIAGPGSFTEEDLVVADVDIAEVARALHRGDGISPRDDRRTDVYSLSLKGGNQQ